MLLSLPATDLLRSALQRRDYLRILIALACLTCCRRGRAVLSSTVGKIWSPVAFLLWLIGLKRRRSHNGNLLCGSNYRNGSNPEQTPRGRIGGWRGAFTKSARSCETGAEAELLKHQDGARGSASVQRAATLGSRGRRMAFERFRELQRVGACCDVTLAVGGKYFKAHKCVLAAQSSPLRAMFEGSFKEGSEDVVALLDVEPSSFSLLLDFLYDRNIEVTEENIEALLDLSARFGVSLLRRHCCAFMAGSANPAKACSLLSVADRYDCRRLRRELLAYTLERFPLMCRDCASDGFLHLSPGLLAEVLKDDRLAAGDDGEVAVFWAAVSWLEADLSRRRNADEVLSHVRFGLVPAKAIADEVEAHPFMQSEAGKAFVHEAYRYHALPPESREDFASSMAARARPRTVAAEAGGGGGCGIGVGSGGRGGRNAGRLSSAFLRPNRRGHGSGVGGEGFTGWVSGADDFNDHHGDGVSSCDEIEDWGREGSGDSESEREGGLVVAGGEGGGCGCGGGGEDARSALVSESEEEMGERERGKEAGSGESSRLGDESSKKSHVADGSPTRRLWGAGLRMYV